MIVGSFYIFQTRHGSWSPSRTYPDEFIALQEATGQLQSMAQQRPPLGVTEVPIAVNVYTLDAGGRVRCASVGLDEAQTARVFKAALDDFFDHHVEALQQTAQALKDARAERDEALANLPADPTESDVQVDEGAPPWDEPQPKREQVWLKPIEPEQRTGEEPV